MMATRIPMIDVQTREERDRDLGFGSLVSQQRHIRLLNRDGSFNVRRKQSLLDSLGSYHALLTMSWPAFIALVASAYAFVNVAFAVMYLCLGSDALETASPPELSPRFLKAFFFSIDAFSTIGYGNIVPVGRAANAVVGIEAFCGLLGCWLLGDISRPDLLDTAMKVAALLADETAVVARVGRWSLVVGRRSLVVSSSGCPARSRRASPPGPAPATLR